MGHLVCRCCRTASMYIHVQLELLNSLQLRTTMTNIRNIHACIYKFTSLSIIPTTKSHTITLSITTYAHTRWNVFTTILIAQKKITPAPVLQIKVSLDSQHLPFLAHFVRRQSLRCRYRRHPFPQSSSSICQISV